MDLSIISHSLYLSYKRNTKTTQFQFIQFNLRFRPIFILNRLKIYPTWFLWNENIIMNHKRSMTKLLVIETPNAQAKRLVIDNPRQRTSYTHSSPSNSNCCESKTSTNFTQNPFNSTHFWEFFIDEPYWLVCLHFPSLNFVSFWMNSYSFFFYCYWVYFRFEKFCIFLCLIQLGLILMWYLWSGYFLCLMFIG